MSPKPDVSEARKNQIIEAAIRVFSRLGFHEARMDDIVQEAGLSKGALYWYFKSKDEVIMAILENLFIREMAGLRTLQEGQGSASDLLHDFTRLTVKELKRVERLLPIAYEFYALAFRNKTVRQATRVYLQTYVQLLTPLIQKGIDQGEFHVANAEETAISIGAIIEGTLFLWAFNPEQVRLEEQINQSMTVFIAGLKDG